MKRYSFYASALALLSAAGCGGGPGAVEDTATSTGVPTIEGKTTAETSPAPEITAPEVTAPEASAPEATPPAEAPKP